MHDQILPSNLTFVKVEIATYLANGFGDGTRIDYGSGHELAFVAWLCSLELLDLFDSKDYQALVLRVFTRYNLLLR